MNTTARTAASSAPGAAPPSPAIPASLRIARRIALLAAVLLLIAGPFPAAGEAPKKPERRKLAVATVLDGIPCDAGWAWLDPEGHLRSCRLSRPFSLGKADLPAGAWLSLRADRTIEYVFLPRETRVQGHVCRGRGHDYMTTFHPGGELKLCWLADGETIDGIPCREGGFWTDILGESSGTLLHPDGRLAGCELAADTTIAGKAFLKGQRVGLDPAGNLAQTRPEP